MPRRAPRRVNHLSIAKMVAYLAECPATVDEAAEASGLSAPTARRMVLALHDEKVLRVVGWEQDSIGRYTTKVYLLQKGADARKPAPARARNAARREARDRKAQMQIQNAIAGVAS